MANNRTLLSLLGVALLGSSLGVVPALAAGKPGTGTAPAPALLYINKSGAIEVSNADGSAAAVVVASGGIHRPNWSPESQNNINNKDNPAKIVFERGICQLHEVDVWVENNVVKSTPAAFERVLPTAGAGIQDQACAADLNGTMLVSGESYTDTPTSDLFTMTRIPDGTPSGTWTTPVAIYDVPYTNITNENTITWSSLSPLGDYIAFAEHQGAPANRARIKIIASNGLGPVSTVLNNSSYVPALMEWSPQGNTLAFASSGGLYTMELVPPVNGEWAKSEPVLLVSGGNSPTWSGTGTIYFDNSNGISTISKTAGAWGAAKLLIRGARRPRYRN